MKERTHHRRHRHVAENGRLIIGSNPNFPRFSSFPPLPCILPLRFSSFSAQAHRFWTNHRSRALADARPRWTPRTRDSRGAHHQGSILEHFHNLVVVARLALVNPEFYFIRTVQYMLLYDIVSPSIMSAIKNNNSCWKTQSVADLTRRNWLTVPT